MWPQSSNRICGRQLIWKEINMRRCQCTVSFSSASFCKFQTPGDEENGAAWNARLQQLMRAAQTLGSGSSQFIINAASPMSIYDDESDGPFGISGRLEDEELSPDEEEHDEHQDSDDEIYVEEDEVEDAREAWRNLRTASVHAILHWTMLERCTVELCVEWPLATCKWIEEIGSRKKDIKEREGAAFGRDDSKFGSCVLSCVVNFQRGKLLSEELRSWPDFLRIPFWKKPIGFSCVPCCRISWSFGAKS